MNMKKKVATLGLVAAMLLTSAGATLAYFTDDDSKTNIMTVGAVDIHIDERTKDENGEIIPMPEDGKVPVPMYPISDDQGMFLYNKIIDTYNDAEDEAYVRNIVFIEELTGFTLCDGVDCIDRTELHTGYCDRNSTGVYGSTNYTVENVKIGNKEYTAIVYETLDGAALKKDERMQTLQSVWFGKGVTQEDLESATELEDGLQILALSQGVQTAGFEDYKEAMDSFGEVNVDNLAKWYAEAAAND